MPRTIHDLPPELIHHILSHLSPSSTPDKKPLKPGSDALPSTFDRISIYGAFASASRQLYETSAPFLYSSLTVNAIVNNIGEDYWRHEPLAYHGIRDLSLQRQIRSLKEFITAGDSAIGTQEDGFVRKTRKGMCGYIKEVTLVFVNQQTTRPGLYRVPHCQACAMSQAEYDAAKPLAKADFEDYIEAMPHARSTLGDLVSVLERLEGLESFAVLKRRNREREPQWGCDPLELGGWVDVRDDGYADGLEELSWGMMRQIVRLSNLPTLRRLYLNCRLPPLLWACNVNLVHVKVKGVLGEREDPEKEPPLWSRIKRLIEETHSLRWTEDQGARVLTVEKMKMEAVEDGPDGMLALVDGGQESLRRVGTARFDIRYHGKGRDDAIETWLYKFLKISTDSLGNLELAVVELPKFRSADSAVLDSLPALPLLHRVHVSFKTDLRRPRVWKRLAVLLQPILCNAPNLFELSLGMIEPGQPSWDSAHCDKTLVLVEELDETMRTMIASHAGVERVKVRIEHNCGSTDRCKWRVAQGDWFRLARENGKEVVIELAKRS